MIALALETSREPLAVALVAWRSRATLPMGLGALRELRREFDLELAIVDNASGDGTADEARRLAPWATVVENPANLGFARASNQAASLTRAPWLLFLNPDAGMEAADARRLIEALQ
ncbi:MAG: glycosyltransferase, partial [Candidatus Sumerlaeota bacterium]|nr:glycosyltransferase [Candidatus Sumerlaeota bacterium]